VGGAQRNARKKRQARQAGGSPAVAAARRTGDRKKLVIGAAVVVVLLAAVIGGVVFYNNNKNATEGKDIKAAVPSTSQQATGTSAPPAYQVARADGVVIVGDDTAKVTLDVYEDFLCPACGAFEAANGADIEKHVEAGTVQVRYHMLPMLNESSDPPGYSMDSANAGLCAADAGMFPGYHKSLFKDQPEEGGRGWDREQLVKLGNLIGISSADFKACVTSGKYDSLVQGNFDEVKKTTYLQQDVGGGKKGFGTPTIAVGEKVVDTAKSNWLDKLIASAD